MPIIDAHHHFWCFNEAEYGWIPPEWSALRRDFGPFELKQAMDSAGVEGVISVQARQSLEESRWLLGLAEKNEFIRGVVGWVPLLDAQVDTVLDEFLPHPKWCACRHVLQGETDDRYMLQPDFQRGIRALTQRGLVYDLLVYSRHLTVATELVDQHPQQIFVLDHLAKPLIRSQILEPWAKDLRELARRPNVYAKISGLITEDDVKTWTPPRLSPYLEVALAAFGPSRLLFGSDWPVCLAGCDYRLWKETVEQSLHTLSTDERAAIMGENALRVYGQAGGSR